MERELTLTRSLPGRARVSLRRRGQATDQTATRRDRGLERPSPGRLGLDSGLGEPQQDENGGWSRFGLDSGLGEPQQDENRPSPGASVWTRLACARPSQRFSSSKTAKTYGGKGRQQRELRDAPAGKAVQAFKMKQTARRAPSPLIF
jgi:hypothetical protein